IGPSDHMQVDADADAAAEAIANFVAGDVVDGPADVPANRTAKRSAAHTPTHQPGRIEVLLAAPDIDREDYVEPLSPIDSVRNVLAELKNKDGRVQFEVEFDDGTVNQVSYRCRHPLALGPRPPALLRAGHSPLPYHPRL